MGCLVSLDGTRDELLQRFDIGELTALRLGVAQLAFAFKGILLSLVDRHFETTGLAFVHESAVRKLAGEVL